MPSKIAAGKSASLIVKSFRIPEKSNSAIRNKSIPESGAGEGSRDLKNAVNSFKMHFIEKVLEENNWNQTEAAKAMNIQRTYLSRLIKDFSIQGKGS